MRIEDLGHDEAMALWMASLTGNAALAFQLERLGLSDRVESLDDTRALIPLIAEAVEDARRNA